MKEKPLWYMAREGESGQGKRKVGVVLRNSNFPRRLPLLHSHMTGGRDF